MGITPERKAMFDTEFVQSHIDAAIAAGLTEHGDNLRNGLMGNLLYCPFGSPLEMAFFAWWTVLGQNRGFSELEILIQQEVTVADAHYRVDFEVRRRQHRVEEVGRELGLVVPRVAIEVDGHDFHERTKEQVMHRDSRDRALQSSGWVVLHVSGSAFHRDPEECVWRLSLDVESVFWTFDKQVLGITATRPSGANP